VCPGTNAYSAVKSAVCQALDVPAHPAQDNAGANCDALSLGFGFAAQPANLGIVVTPPQAVNNCTPDGGADDAAGVDDCTR
jgi:hypothetical protein